MTAPSRKKNVVVMGGGTGTYTALSGLKKHLDLTLSAIVSVADDGGSSGILRDELGVLPYGDTLRCLIALAEDEVGWREVCSLRFKEGSFLQKHSVGNLILAALEEATEDPNAVMRWAERLLRVRGRVIPVALRSVKLCAILDDETSLTGEHKIDLPVLGRSPIDHCYLRGADPSQANPPTANLDAVRAIEEADAVVLGPGDLHTSIVPVLLVDGIRQALAQTNAKIMYALNLFTKPGQTEGFGTVEFCRELSIYLGDAPLHHVLVNTTKPPADLLRAYLGQGEHPVVDNFGARPRQPFAVNRAALIADTAVTPLNGDPIRRSLLRHDPDRLASLIVSLLE